MLKSDHKRTSTSYWKKEKTYDALTASAGAGAAVGAGAFVGALLK